MKQTLFCLTRPLAAALLCGALAAPAIAATPQDAMLTTQVREALALRAGLESNTIGVRTEAGVVQLEGQVENDEVAARALDAASDVQGVREVRSLLVVRRAL
ncbi:MAG: BON domain-containing protein [Bordetella sp.]|nr:BON domain-containing protein [Bordetella genomosp. 1]MDQ8032881.1 BON domain-containing protein [Bordetella sp.]